MGLFENLPFPILNLATLTKLPFPVYVSCTIPRGHDKGGLLSSVIYCNNYKTDASFKKTENDLIGSQIIKRDQYLNLWEKFKFGQTLRLFAKCALRER